MIAGASFWSTPRSLAKTLRHGAAVAGRGQAAGRDLLLDIDVQGARQVRAEDSRGGQHLCHAAQSKGLAHPIAQSQPR
jgi:hypothetical protein